MTERTLACKLLGHYIWKVTGTEILPCNPRQSGLNSQQRLDEVEFIKLLKSFLASEWIYYSSTYDLTRSAQSEVMSRNITSFLRADMQFVVNRFIAEPFLAILQQRTDTRLEHFLVFCVEGCKAFSHHRVVMLLSCGAKDIDIALQASDIWIDFSTSNWEGW